MEDFWTDVVMSEYSDYFDPAEELALIDDALLAEQEVEFNED